LAWFLGLTVWLDWMGDVATYNQRLSRIRVFFARAATAEATLAMRLADFSSIARLRKPHNRG